MNALFLKVDWETPHGQKEVGVHTPVSRSKDAGCEAPRHPLGAKREGSWAVLGPRCDLSCACPAQGGQMSSRGLRMKPPGSLSTISYNHRLSGSVASNSLQPHGLQPTGPSVHGILQAGTRGWAAVPSSRGASRPRDGTRVSCSAGRFFTTEPAGKPQPHVRLKCSGNNMSNLKSHNNGSTLIWPEILGCSSKIAEESFPCYKKYFSAEKCTPRSALLTFFLPEWNLLDSARIHQGQGGRHCHPKFLHKDHRETQAGLM